MKDSPPSIPANPALTYRCNGLLPRRFAYPLPCAHCQPAPAAERCAGMAHGAGSRPLLRGRPRGGPALQGAARGGRSGCTSGASRAAGTCSPTPYRTYSPPAGRYAKTCTPRPATAPNPVPWLCTTTAHRALQMAERPDRPGMQTAAFTLLAGLHGWGGPAALAADIAGAAIPAAAARTVALAAHTSTVSTCPATTGSSASTRLTWLLVPLLGAGVPAPARSRRR